MKRDTRHRSFVRGVRADTSGGVGGIIDLDHRFNVGAVITSKHSMVVVKINHSVHDYYRVSMEMRFDNLAWVR